LNRFEEAAALLTPGVAAHLSDVVPTYGLGLAQAMLGQDAQARQTLTKVPSASAYGSAAAIQLALLSARAKDDADALTILESRADQHPGSVKIGGFAIALLRRSGHKQEALQLLNRLYAVDPADNMLRFERVLLGSEDEDLWEHLAVDGERVLNLVDEYLSLGSDEDALRLLSRTYPPLSDDEIEPGAVPAAIHPMIAYYRAFVRARLGQDATEDLSIAGAGVTRYVFPNRSSSVAVLKGALAANPSDAHARIFLGRLFLNQLEVDEAIAQWREAQKRCPTCPELDRELGQVLADLKRIPADRR
jgi:tetratricopeptide (TPR) repeat protein